MSDPRTAGRPAQYPTERQRRRAMEEKRRRRKRARTGSARRETEADTKEKGR